MHYVSGIIELDEQKEVLKSIGRFNLQWTDELLRWHPINEARMHNKTWRVSLHIDYSRKSSIWGSVLLTLQIVSIFNSTLISHHYNLAAIYIDIALL